jgi:MFS family permease
LASNNVNDPYASLRIKDFRIYLSARILTTIGLLMQSTIVAWLVYEITNDKLALGLIGLSEALPFIFSTFYSGYASDKFNRKTLLVGFTWVLAGCSLLLTLLNFYGNFVFVEYGAIPIYMVIALSGIARAFIAPTTQAIQARIVPRGLYANASTWSSNIFQIGAVIGPLIGGFTLELFNPTIAMVIVVVLISASAFLKSFIPDQPVSKDIKQESFFKSLKEGLRFVFKSQPIVSSISLDLFAVLFGGVVALLPAFCKDILQVGPTALGLLRGSQFMGSAAMGFMLAYFPPLKNAGRNLLISIALFGICIIGFALSEIYWLSFIFLFLSGAFDNVSVIIRSTILQLYTPDSMRGRVSSVNSLFIKSSNEIGDFESGLAAKILGLVPAVIFGGSMTLVVVGFTAWFAPALRKIDLTKDPEEIEE